MKFNPGDSTITIPKFIKDTNEKFDLIYVDGAHTYNVCKSDIENCKKLAHPKTILWIDDYFDPISEYWFGIKNVVDDLVAQSIIEIIGIYESIDDNNMHKRRWVEARYIFDNLKK